MSTQEQPITDPQELKVHIAYVEKRLLNGFKNNNAFDLLEAESALERIGTFEPSEELRDLALRFLKGQHYHTDFDMLRLTGYMKDEQICTLLEKRFDDLKEIWKEQDVIRMAESYRTALMNVTRRANELSSLKIAADPYLNTLDVFFEKIFTQQKVERFPQLAKLQQRLVQLRDEGLLSKDNILTVIDKSRSSIDKLVYQKEQELKHKYRGSLPKPNRLIALYYCLLECLLLQRSRIVKVDDEFVDKISQDFRAAVGHGTKRFVLNTLLKFNHPGFAEIAAEARYGIQHSIIEKVERKERGELEWRMAKVDLNEMQVFELYRTATDVISRNPNPEVFETLLYTYTVPALLMGLRGLENAEIPALNKLKYLKRFFGLGTVNDYVFIRSVEVLSQVAAPAAKEELGKLLASRYGWRKVTIPKLAFTLMNEGFESVISSSDLMSIADGLVDEERRQAFDENEEMGYPYDNNVYEMALERLIARFEKNPFHGVNEIALQEFYKRMLVFIAGTQPTFALKAKKRLLELMRRPQQQMSIPRIKYLQEQIKLSRDKLEKRYKEVDDKNRTAMNSLKTGFAQTQQSLKMMESGYKDLEKLVRSIPLKLASYLQTGLMGSLEEREFKPLLETIYLKGTKMMNDRTRNLDISAKKKGERDERLYPKRYPVSSSGILRAAPALKKYARGKDDEKLNHILNSMRVENSYSFPHKKSEAPGKEKTEELWREFGDTLEKPILESEAFTRSVYLGSLVFGAASHGMMEVLDQVFRGVYADEKPVSIRMAVLGSLPVKAEFAPFWLYALSREDEASLLAVRNELGEEQCRKLQTIVPELVDIFY